MKNKTALILKLANDLRDKGYSSFASELEYKYLILKKSETNFYSVINEVGQDLIDQAHPEGSHKLVGVDGDSTFETISDQKEKIEKIVAKDPIGKLSNKKIVDIIKSAGKGGKGGAQQAAGQAAGAVAAEAGFSVARALGRFFGRFRTPGGALQNIGGALIAGSAVSSVWDKVFQEIITVDEAIANDSAKITDLLNKMINKLANVSTESSSTLAEFKKLLISTRDNLPQSAPGTAEERKAFADKVKDLISKLQSGKTDTLSMIFRAVTPGYEFEAFNEINSMMENSKLIEALSSIEQAYRKTGEIVAKVQEANTAQVDTNVDQVEKNKLVDLLKQNKEKINSTLDWNIDWYISNSESLTVKNINEIKKALDAVHISYK